jgi:hypothetical protein
VGNLLEKQTITHRKPGTCLNTYGKEPGMVKPDLSTPENRAYWEFVRKTSEEVKSWPEWMKGTRDVYKHKNMPRL